MCLTSCEQKPKKAAVVVKSKQVQKLKADTVSQESKVIDLILDLEEVRNRTQGVEKESQGKRTLATYVESPPTREDPNYWVKVAEDNGYAYVTYYTFTVNPKDYSISFYEPIEGNLITLAEWRRTVPLTDR
ncbi:hypothetical protein CLV32_4573 [Pedobacter duraquae]|uniref:Uncharacterized protein n=2 Tax=Pedobacter duraquae TaxID=425511 RepID=A0A4R6IAT8_9SPHI|nr:hypothetical protein CLV32_4573 [Pedobacter duraquae]